MLGKREKAALSTACVMLGYQAWTFARALEYLVQRNLDEVLDKGMFRSALLLHEKSGSKIQAIHRLEEMREEKLEEEKGDG